MGAGNLEDFVTPSLPESFTHLLANRLLLKSQFKSGILPFCQVHSYSKQICEVWDYTLQKDPVVLLCCLHRQVYADTAPFLLVARTSTVWTTRTPKGRQPWDVTRVSIWCRRRASGPAPRTAVDMDSGKFLPSFSFWQILTFCRFLDSKFDILLCS